MTAHDWNVWTWWSATPGTPPIPARWEDLQAFLADVPCAPPTAARRISTIRAAHVWERAGSLVSPNDPRPHRSSTGQK